MLEFLAAERARWSGLNSRAGALVDAVSDLVNAGGKRLRPAFCLSGYLAAGGDADNPHAVAAAVGLEMLHACALIHDDVMDESPLRRGMPTVYVRHMAAHSHCQWRGDARRYGENVAILAGDLALVYADRFLAEAPSAVAAMWGELRSELIVGQYLDVAAAAEVTAAPDLARLIALVKSGRYTIHRPLVLGASIAGREDLGKVFEAYGMAVGEAFQLRDDLLDLFGNATDTGKPAGLDIERHKMTLLLTLAMERDPGLRTMVSSGNGDSAQLGERIARAGVRKDVEELIGRLVNQACEAISHAPLEKEWQDELTAMAHTVAYRET